MDFDECNNLAINDFEEDVDYDNLTYQEQVEYAAKQNKLIVSIFF